MSKSNINKSNKKDFICWKYPLPFKCVIPSIVFTSILLSTFLVNNELLVISKTKLCKQSLNHHPQQNHPNHSNHHHQEEVSFSNETFLPLAWLMSFPNSGTSFTMKLFRKISNHSVGTNYPLEAHHSVNSSSSSSNHYQKEPLPIIPGPAASLGPFWERSFPHFTMPMKEQNRFVLVKTHCGGKCIHCPPDEYVETIWSFDEMCRFYHRHQYKNYSLSFYDDEAKKKKKKIVPPKAYSSEYVKKAVHLIRDPFNNVVSRFHHDYKVEYGLAKNKTLYEEKHNLTVRGFQQWCGEQDQKYAKDVIRSRFIPADIINMMARTRCHGEFFRYVQWHNLAYELTHQLRPIPTLILHYEDYNPSTFHEKANSLLDFLGYPLVKENIESNNDLFINGKDYHDFFSPRQKQNIWKFILKMATPDIQDLLERYNPIYHNSSI